MGKYDGYLILSDLDNTLTHQGHLIDKNTKAIRQYIKEGGLFTLSTGRTPAFLFDTYGKENLLINTYIICLNGTVIYDPINKNIVWQSSVPKEVLSNLEQIAKDYKGILSVTYYCFETSYNHYREIPNGGINKTVIAFDTADNCDRLRKRLETEYRGVFEFNKSWDTGLEILPEGAGKGTCIRMLRQLLKNKVKTVIAAGDNENDLTMLREADIGYAVENAIPQLKAVADRITVSCDRGAIARIIEDIYGHTDK